MTDVRSGTGRALPIVMLAGLLVYAAGIGLASFAWAGILTRLVALAILAYVAACRRSLTGWTFFAILTGAELGADAPTVATHLHVLAEIFLRLVRVIVAPLILGTLSTGIAGHGQLKSLGRVALKTLLYFEVVTTLALIIGAVAIDLSRAGEGVAIPAPLQSQPVPATSVVHPGFETFLLNVFPDNLAAAVAQNQILDRKSVV